MNIPLLILLALVAWIHDCSSWLTPISEPTTCISPQSGVECTSITNKTDCDYSICKWDTLELSCGCSKDLSVNSDGDSCTFDILPIHPDAITTINPMGAAGPGGHTLPNGYIYLNHE